MTNSRSNEDGGARQLTIEEKKYAAAYLNETDENRASAIAEIRRWILESDDLCARIDDFFILRFLRACKFNIEKTKIKIRSYYQQRSDLPEWYENRDPFLSQLQKLFDLGIFLPLRKLDDQGRLVIFVRPTLHDPYEHKMSELLKVCLMIMDFTSRDHVPASVNGVVAIIDLKDISFGHFLQLRPHVIKNLVHSWQGCYPVRIQSINFINVSICVDVVLKIFKQFMNAKLKQRLRVYGSDMKKWVEELPADILPVEYGGTDGTVQELAEYRKRLIQENHNWFVEDEKYKVLSK